MTRLTNTSPDAINALGYSFEADGADGFSIALSFTENGNDQGLLSVVLSSESSRRPTPLKLEWRVPSVDIQGHWNPSCGSYRGNKVDWSNKYASQGHTGAPVLCLYSDSGLNRLTFAVSDVLNPVEIRAGIVEEDGTFRCRVTLFDTTQAPLSHYRMEIWLDKRTIKYERALDAVSKWWASMPKLQPVKVPEVARMPVYSTWYTFHQKLATETIEEQCRLSKELGCETVIVDDGWETDSTARGFAFCGDWEPTPTKIEDMKSHVARVHSLGMKYVLWLALPYVGTTTRNYERFKDKVLYEHKGAWTLDPRFPEVRDHLVALLANRMAEWDIDGFKLDFIDSFFVPLNKKDELGQGRDIDSMPAAVDVLLTKLQKTLQSQKADVLIEFRQSYVGPAMRKYGNMFRAADCPGDSWYNRIRTIDIRLIAGTTPAHSDMVMWHPDDPVESAALQLWHTLFSVPQISIPLDKISKQHHDMVRWYLAFWNKYSTVLLDGELSAASPNLLYPLVHSELEGTTVWASYGEKLIILPSGSFEQHIFVNATREEGLVVDCSQICGCAMLRVVDCKGVEITSTIIQLKGIERFYIPPSGVAFLESH